VRNEWDKTLLLLEDENLVWSDDFELIRKNLAKLIKAYALADKRAVWLEMRELVERLSNGIA
jgi:hypothetical protein